ncbi:winged helix-turn-helix domain-containing protein [Sphingobium sp. HWE2-09]|uniref:winged helix-turn-helix domain-containing protein n=1 Tax=Sphingobium sp. HWE2-09 TaxID=3108390 RepID=UPI002DD396E3|nr:winged helix-turn-helix domain-containing protein [Sphingobium sp. HWE2-09]
MKLLFEDFSLDPDLRELQRAGVPVTLAPKVFDLLYLLVAHHDRIVSKDFMVAEVWNGRIVSDSTLASHVNAVRKAIGDDGTQQRFVRTKARRGFRFIAAVREQGRSASTVRTLVLKPDDALDRSVSRPLPLLVVTPVLSHSMDRSDAHFADGLHDELLVGLARMPLIGVVADGARLVDPMASGVRSDYRLDCSVRSSNGRRRVSMRLGTSGGICLWTGCIDVDDGDQIDAQERISRCVVAALVDCLKRTEVDRVLQKDPERLNYYDHFILGQSLMARKGRVELERAVAAFHRSVELNPDFGPAYAAAAWSLVMKKQALWMDDVDRESAEGARLAQAAVTNSDDDPVALTRGSYALGHFGEDLEICGAYMDKALRVGPGCAFAWALSGGQLLSAGRRAEALARIARASRENPTEAEMADIAILTSLAQLLGSQSDEASQSSQTAFLLDPHNPRAMALNAASNLVGGRLSDAERAMRLLRRHNPALRVSSVRNWVHLRKKEDLQLFADGLRGAGLPS